MNGLRPTVEKRGKQALSATSSRITQYTTTATLPSTDSIYAGRRKDSPARKHAEASSDVARRKKGGTKEGKQVYTQMNPRNPQVIQSRRKI